MLFNIERSVPYTLPVVSYKSNYWRKKIQSDTFQRKEFVILNICVLKPSLIMPMYDTWTSYTAQYPFKL